MNKKAIPIGVERYKEIIDKDYYYIDKTLMMKDLLDKKGKVNLFTRPRRFGKTLTLSMIKTFFEQEISVNEIADNRRYFDGMKIMEAGEEYTKHIGQYPVISLSLKSAKQPDFKMAHRCLVEMIAREFKRHMYVLNGEELLESEKNRFDDIMQERADYEEYLTSIAFLSECLKKYHNKNVIILIDEYDVPLENAYFEGFYDEMVKFIRSLFESSLKTNDNLEFAVITGCLRISRESIFTGLNNLNVNSLLTVDYAEYFGFVQEEVEQMLGDYGLDHKKDEIKKWYDGYLFGDTEVYNPWSVINYVRTAVSSDTAFPRPYWSNTSSNSIVRELIERADSSTKKDIEQLIDGGTLEVPVHEDITYDDVYNSQDNLWNFLFFTGYLKKVSERFEEDTIYVTVRIPNVEVRSIYRRTIIEWFDKKVKKADFSSFYKALLNNDCEAMGDFISGQLAGSISFYDSAESFYHGYMVGVLGGIEGYDLESNREKGLGRPDLVLTPANPKKSVIIIELKKADKFTQMEQKCDEGLAQIKDRQYALPYLDEGYAGVVSLAICFCKKSAVVKVGS